MTLYKENDIKDVTLRDLSGARKLLKSAHDGYEKYSSSFLFCTERQDAINGIIDYRGKKVLTPASSGDQYIGAVYYDAKEVETYDINRITFYITCLKIAAIRELDYEEFIAFFTPLDEFGCLRKSFWNLKTLKRLLKILPFDVAYFWDNIMFEAQKKGFKFLTYPEHNSNELYNIKSGMPFYKNKEEYYKLQRKLRERDYPRFIESDLLALKEKLSSTYDIIYLSNIIEYLVCLELRKYYMGNINIENHHEKDITKKVMRQVLPFLEDNGTILVSYRMNRDYNCSKDWLYNNDFFDVDVIPSKFPPNFYSRNSGDTDLVLTYRPKKTGKTVQF